VDMQIDSKRIRAERGKRAWSQEHLAQVAGLAMRTIQRVETSGAGSLETAKALAAVFEIDVATLRAAAVTPQVTFTKRARYWSATASVVLAVLLVFVTRAAVAGQVLLDVGLNIDGTELGKNQLITAEGKDAEIRLDGQLRLVLLPTINEDGSVALAMQVYEFKGGTFVLMSRPKMFVADNNRAEVHLTSSGGSVIRIAVTPHKLRS
jgi:transcriptional regulator with XRE-family HTH domain